RRALPVRRQAMGPEPGPSHGPTEALARGSGAALLAVDCRREASPRPQVPQRKPERAARGLRRLRGPPPLAQSWAVERNVARRWRRRVARGPRAVARAPGPQHRAAPRTRRGAAARKARLKDVTAPALRPALDEPLALPPVLLRAWTPGGLLQARPWEPL